MKHAPTALASTTTTNAPFSPLFETTVRRTHRGWCLSFMGPNQGRTPVTRWSLFGHSRPLISSDKPPNLSIESNHGQHTTQAVIKGQLTFWLRKQWCPGAVLVPSLGTSMHSYISIYGSLRINDSRSTGTSCTSVCASIRNLLVMERTYYRYM